MLSCWHERNEVVVGKEWKGEDDGDIAVEGSSKMDKDASSPPKGRKMSGGLRKLPRSGRIDWPTMLAVGDIPRQKCSWMRGNGNNIRRLLRYTLQPDVAHLLAWGSSRVKFGTK